MMTESLRPDAFGRSGDNASFNRPASCPAAAPVAASSASGLAALHGARAQLVRMRDLESGAKRVRGSALPSVRPQLLLGRRGLRSPAARARETAPGRAGSARPVLRGELDVGGRLRQLVARDQQVSRRGCRSSRSADHRSPIRDAGTPDSGGEAESRVGARVQQVFSMTTPTTAPVTAPPMVRGEIDLLPVRLTDRISDGIRTCSSPSGSHAAPLPGSGSLTRSRARQAHDRARRAPKPCLRIDRERQERPGHRSDPEEREEPTPADELSSRSRPCQRDPVQQQMDRSPWRKRRQQPSTLPIAGRG